ncbi:hypothetical protein NFI96_032819, partial [Prochilodus magdalenae]
MFLSSPLSTGATRTVQSYIQNLLDREANDTDNALGIKFDLVFNELRYEHWAEVARVNDEGMYRGSDGSSNVVMAAIQSVEVQREADASWSVALVTQAPSEQDSTPLSGKNPEKRPRPAPQPLEVDTESEDKCNYSYVLPQGGDLRCKDGHPQLEVRDEYHGISTGPLFGPCLSS